MSPASTGSGAGDFIQRAQAWRDQLHYPTAGEMLDEAVGIIDSLRLTDAEREAVERASVAYDLLPTEGARGVAAILRGLLARLK